MRNFELIRKIHVNWTGQQEVKGTWKVCSFGSFGGKWSVHMHTADSTNQSRGGSNGLLSVPVTSGILGSGFSLPYLWGHSANGGQVITSAQEVRSVDLQLKVAQPLDNGLWALQEKKKVAMVSLSSCCFCKTRFCLSSPALSYSIACCNQNCSALIMPQQRIVNYFATWMTECGPSGH